MLIYEAERSDRRGYLYCQRDHNFSFPAHLHHSYEFLTVQAGTLTCTLETDTFAVHPGEALLVLPDQIHSYHTNGASQSVLWIFSDDWVPEFSAQLGQRAFADPVFRIEAAPLMELRCCAGAVPPAPAPPAGCGRPSVGPHHQLCAAELYRQPDAGADGARPWL